tara:strand:- start:11 stop:985 length:975 start_codon:yes stop_codon:yes gene_type:complete
MYSIGFFVRHFGERGTEVAIYDYAKYNIILLGNKSFIFHFSNDTKKKLGWSLTKDSYEKFRAYFEVFEINDISDMKIYIKQLKLTHFYTLTHGGKDIYKFTDKNIWENCKTIKHCVFNASVRDANINLVISPEVCKNTQVLPHMIDLPKCKDNLRNDLKIENDKIVVGNFGGSDSFNISFVHNTIIEYLSVHENIVFLFMNNKTFNYKHKNIIQLPKNVDTLYKMKFINTCDCMLHARNIGETFGIAVGEFAVNNKPVITCRSNIHNAHIDNLENKAILYSNQIELFNIFSNIQNILYSRNDWKAYSDFSANKVITKFSDILKD